VFDQNTTGVASARRTLAPQNGVSFNSDANFKDLYGRFVYRFNLEKDPSEPQRCAGGRAQWDRAIIPTSLWEPSTSMGGPRSPSAACLPTA
jgi:hypothetical protein